MKMKVCPVDVKSDIICPLLSCSNGYFGVMQAQAAGRGAAAPGRGR